MKKLIVFTLMWVMAMAIPVALMAQDVNDVVTPLISLDVYFVTFTAFVAIIVPVTSFLKTYLKIEIPWIKQALSWVVSLVLALIANYFNLGIFSGIIWYQSLIYAIAASLIANGIFDIVIVKSLLKVIGLEPKY